MQSVRGRARGRVHGRDAAVRRAHAGAAEGASTQFLRHRARGSGGADQDDAARRARRAESVQPRRHAHSAVQRERRGADGLSHPLPHHSLLRRRATAHAQPRLGRQGRARPARRAGPAGAGKMSSKIYKVPEDFAALAHLKHADYLRLYQESGRDPHTFWSRIGRRLDWIQPYSKVKDTSYDEKDFRIRWFYDGKLNVAANCLDRHLTKRGDKTAILWESDDPRLSERVTYRQLYERVCQCANALKALGVRKGDRVTIYMPMIPETAVAMLACARIGAVHSVVFGGFSPESLAGRIADCGSTVVITADEGLRGGKRIALKANVDAALAAPGSDCVKHVLVVRRLGSLVPMQADRDRWFEDALAGQAKECPPEVMDAEDPLFILYTSGSTGKPKGVLHTTGGYLVFASMTHQYVFDYHDGDVYWCTADVGWVTGHSYILYGPLANGAITLMFEGVPNYPTNSRFWNVIDKHKVNIFYTAPTAIRALRQAGDAPVKRPSRASLKLLGTVGEPINPEAWEWYYHVVGDSRCPIVDTWWQTETGCVMITPLPGARTQTPASANWPFFVV